MKAACLQRCVCVLSRTVIHAMRCAERAGACGESPSAPHRHNNLHELWALLNFLLPDVFGSSTAFDDYYVDISSDDHRCT